MLRMCRSIFGSGKDVVFNSEFFVLKVITELKSKGVHVASLIKKRRYWPKGVPCDLIDTRFEDNEVGGVGMIQKRTEENKWFKTYFIKVPDYAMKVMASWMILDEFQGAKTRIYFTDSSVTNESKQFIYH